MKSIRSYLRLRVIGGAFAILLAGSIVLALAIRHLDVQEFDATLETKARTFATLVLHDDRAIEVDFAGEFIPAFETEKDTQYFQFRLLDGTTIERSDMLGSRDLPFFPKATASPVFRNLRLPDGRRGRFVQIVFPPRAIKGEESFANGGFQMPGGGNPGAARVVLAYAQSREGLDALLGSVYAALAAVDLLLVGFIALLICIALRKGLRPLEDLHAQIARLGPDALERRIHLPDAPAEIAAFPVSINAFMEALQAAADRERRFTSDVAHELRTPVAEFRAACEVGAKWSDDPALVKKRFDNLRESAANMERMLDGLLDLSRLDRGAAQIHLAPTDVASLVDACWDRVLAGGVGAGLRLENAIDPSLKLSADPVKLEQIFVNILNNAASYSPPHSAVVCTSDRDSGGVWTLRFANAADFLSPDDLPHVFERFWRKDAARTGGGHSGLGLSIVKALAEAMGVQTAAELAPDGIFTICLRFPEEPDG